MPSRFQGWAAGLARSTGFVDSPVALCRHPFRVGLLASLDPRVHELTRGFTPSPFQGWAAGVARSTGSRTHPRLYAVTLPGLAAGLPRSTGSRTHPWLYAVTLPGLDRWSPSIHGFADSPATLRLHPFRVYQSCPQTRPAHFTSTFHKRSPVCEVSMATSRNLLITSMLVIVWRDSGPVVKLPPPAIAIGINN